MDLRLGLPQRFWDKVDTSGECWIWSAGRGATGDCGQFVFEKKPVYPQRLTHLKAVGPIPEGHVMRRECGTNLCVRPGPGHVRFEPQADCLEGEPLTERFWSKVNKDGPAPELAPHLGNCWVWTKRVDSRGYGHFSARGENQRAYCLAYEDAYGPVPEGLVVDHKCWNPACVRPDHLRAVTSLVNAQNRSGALPRSKTGVRGVFMHTDGIGYVAQATANGYKAHIGMFKTIAEAEAAVVAWRREHMPGSLMDQELQPA